MKVLEDIYQTLNRALKKGGLTQITIQNVSEVCRDATLARNSFFGGDPTFEIQTECSSRIYDHIIVLNTEQKRLELNLYYDGDIIEMDITPDSDIRVMIKNGDTLEIFNRPLDSIKYL